MSAHSWVIYLVLVFLGCNANFAGKDAGAGSSSDGGIPLPDGGAMIACGECCWARTAELPAAMQADHPGGATGTWDCDFEPRYCNAARPSDNCPQTADEWASRALILPDGGVDGGQIPITEYLLSDDPAVVCQDPGPCGTDAGVGEAQECLHECIPNEAQIAAGQDFQDGMLRQMRLSGRCDKVLDEYPYLSVKGEYTFQHGERRGNIDFLPTGRLRYADALCTSADNTADIWEFKCYGANSDAEFAANFLAQSATEARHGFQALDYRNKIEAANSFPRGRVPNLDERKRFFVGSRRKPAYLPTTLNYAFCHSIPGWTAKIHLALGIFDHERYPNSNFHTGPANPDKVPPPPPSSADNPSGGWIENPICPKPDFEGYLNVVGIFNDCQDLIGTDADGNPLEIHGFDGLKACGLSGVDFCRGSE